MKSKKNCDYFKEIRDQEKMRVFLIDDSVIMRRRTKKMLSGLEGMEIIGEAGDPFSAINHLGALRPDAMILDDRIQGRFGVDMLQVIRSMTPPPLVIMLTNHMYSNARKGEKGLLADFYFDKFTQRKGIQELLSEFSRSCQRTTGYQRMEGVPPPSR